MGLSEAIFSLPFDRIELVFESSGNSFMNGDENRARSSLAQAAIERSGSNRTRRVAAKISA